MFHFFDFLYRNVLFIDFFLIFSLSLLCSSNIPAVGVSPLSLPRQLSRDKWALVRVPGKTAFGGIRSDEFHNQPPSGVRVSCLWDA